ncbi:MAG: IS5 family transposase [Gemmatimonadales bacterium]|nr:IS5 family transposase [Gemmatimonadales bacterium]
MSQQTTFACDTWATKGKVTRREQFLREMEAVVPWDLLLALIAPHYHPRGRRGRPAHPLPVMLRIYFLQQWYAFSDPQPEEALYDSETMRRFVGLELGEDTVPDESTILRFRHLLERHQLTAQIFDAVRDLLEERRLLLKADTIVDATIIAAPSTTKNATGTRDPEMRQTKKGNQWYFGMKAHIGTDTKGVVYSLVGTDAAVADITQLPQLLRGTETVLYGDQGYDSQANADAWEAGGGRYRVQRRGRLTPQKQRINRARSRVRSMVEHPFHVVKQLWGYTKVRYRGLAKNTAQLFTLFALSNLYRLRYRLCPALAGTR